MWYDYLANTTFATTGTSQNITLAPGEFRVFVNRNINNLTPTPVGNIPWNGMEMYARPYPNPASGNLNLEIKLPQSAKVTIDLYNAIGQHNATLHQGFLTAGEHDLSFKINNMANGNYYLAIKTPASTKTIQVILQ